MSDELNNIELEESEYITLEFDDDTAVDCEVLGTFDCKGKEYIALAPDDGTEDVYIYGFKLVSEDEFELEEIDDEAEFDAAAAEFDSIIESQEE